MKESSTYYAFRGNIAFPKQITIFTLGENNNSSHKNQIFKDFFDNLQKLENVESDYNSRTYYLLFKNVYGNIIHCQLARKKIYEKHEIEDNKLLLVIDEDYPNVNIFVDIPTQKFLIESNTKSFTNYNTCANVFKNIFEAYYRNNLQDISLEMNPISEEKNFWYYFDTKKKIYSLQFVLCTPNFFGGESAVKDFLRSAEEHTNAKQVETKFSNKDGELKTTRESVDAYVQYASVGAGKWFIRYLNDSNKVVTVSSSKDSVKTSLPISSQELIELKLGDNIIKILQTKFKEIEPLEQLKELDGKL